MATLEQIDDGMIPIVEAIKEQLVDSILITFRVGQDAYSFWSEGGYHLPNTTKRITIDVYLKDSYYGKQR